MIIIGYQGIGKSTLSNSENRFIDLESGNFWVEGHRSPDWPVVYTNIAVHLYKQGYYVFTSSHEVVRNEFRKYTKYTKYSIPIAVCYPSLDLRDEWCKKLEDRYNRTSLEKDFKAWKNAVDVYDKNIMELMAETKFIHIELKSMNYYLKDEIIKAYANYRRQLNDI